MRFQTQQFNNALENVELHSVLSLDALLVLLLTTREEISDIREALYNLQASLSYLHETPPPKKCFLAFITHTITKCTSIQS